MIEEMSDIILAIQKDCNLPNFRWQSFSTVGLNIDSKIYIL